MFNWKKLTKLLTLIIMFFVAASVFVYAANSNNVQIELISKKKVDVILTKSRTATDLLNFKEDLIAELQQRGVNTNNVNIYIQQEDEENVLKTINWNVDHIDDKYGNIQIKSATPEISITGAKDEGKNVMYVLGEDNIYSKISFDYSYDLGDSIDQAGILVGLSEEVDNEGEKYLTGYMISFNNQESNPDKYETYASLWKCEKINHYNNASKIEEQTKITDLDVEKSGSLVVESSSAGIIITGGGLDAPYIYQIDDYCGNGIGFLASYYEHNCDQAGLLDFSNVSINQYNAYDLQEVLKNNIGNTDAEKVIVNVSDYSNSNLIDKEILSDNLIRMLNNKSHFIGWGNSVNENEMKNFIKQNEDRGMFTYNQNYNQAIKDTAEYIKNLLDDVTTYSDYILLGEDIDVKVTPNEIRDNTSVGEYKSGSWKVEHEYTYFENNQGQYEKTGFYTDGIIESFPKVGKYTILYKDENVKEVYVHRKPIADFAFTVTDGVAAFTNLSYDLDKQSENNGISEEKWSYKIVGETDWIERKLIDVDPDKTYIVKLVVKDFQETWSDEVTKVISSEGKPVAQFKLKEDKVSFYKNLEVTDLSYDPSGKPLAMYEYYILDSTGAEIYYGDKPELNCMNIGIGKFTMGLKVVNSEDVESDACTKDFEILEDTTPPDLIATPTEKKALNEKLNVMLRFTDDESGFKYYKYAITYNEEEITSDDDWSNEIYRAMDSIEITERNMETYIHIISCDNMDNISEEKVIGPFELSTTDFDLEIHVTDDMNAGINLADAKFSLVHPKSDVPDERIIYSEVTNVDGVCNLYGKVMPAGTYEFILQEIDAPVGYNNVGLVLLNITFNNDGEIVNFEKKYNDLYDIVSWDKSKAVINIRNQKDSEISNGFSVQLDVVDREDGITPVENVTYRFVEKAASGEKKSITDSSNSAGRIKVRKQFTGSGEIIIYLQQINSNGFILDSDEKVVVVQRDSDTGNMTVVDWKCSTGLTVSVDNNTQTIEVKADIERKQRNNVVKISAADVVDNDITLSNLSVKLINKANQAESTHQILDGKLEIPMVAPGVGKYEYEIRLGGIPSEYVVPSAIKLEVEFDKYGAISNITELTSGCITVEKNVNEEKKVINTDCNVVIGLNRSNSFNPYKLYITTIDADETSKRLEGTEYQITVKNNTSETVINKKTDAMGRLTADISCNVDSIIQILETKAKKGYILDSTTKVIDFQLDQNNMIEIKNFTSTLDVNMNPALKEISVYDKNTKKINADGAKGNISFYVTKKDNDGNLLANVGLSIFEVTTQTQINVNTDEFGRAVVEDFAVPNEGEYEFRIKETSFVPGYDGEVADITLYLNYEIYDNQLDCSTQIVKKGEKYVRNKKFNQYETDTTYQLDIEFDLINSLLGDSIDSKNKYKVDMKNVDELTNDIFAGGRYKFWIKYENGTSIYKGEIEAVNGIELSAIAIYDNTTILLQEIEKPLGYDEDDEIHIIEIGTDDDGNFIVKNTSSKINAQILVASNDNYTVDNVLDIEITRKRSIKPFDIKVITRSADLYNPVNEVVIKDVKYNLKVDGVDLGNAITNNKGEANYNNAIAIKQFKMELTEIDVPKGYQNDEDVKHIVMNRDEITNEFTCVSTDSNISVRDIVIDNDNQLVTIIVNKAQQFKIKIKKVDAEDETKVLENAKFEITSNNATHGFKECTTDSNGMADVVYNHVVNNTGVVYIIKEVQTPSGYNMGAGKSFRLIVYYDNFGRIDDFALQNLDGTECDWAEVNLPFKYELNTTTGQYEKVNQYKRNDEISIVVKNSNNYKFILKKIDETNNQNGNNSVNISGAEFNIEIECENKKKTFTKKTVNGIIELEGLEGNGEITISYEEINAAYGYENTHEKGKIVFNRSMIENALTINSNKTTVDSSRLTLDTVGQTVKVVVTNSSKFNIGLKTSDALTKDKLAGAKYKITSSKGDTDTKETDAEGELIASVGRTYRSEVVRYTISELSAPTGYSQIYNTIDDIVIDVTFDSLGKANSYTIVSGNSRVVNVETSGGSLASNISSRFNNNELNIEVEEGEQDSYTIKFISENKNNSSVKVTGHEYQIIGYNSDGSVQFNKTSIESGNGGLITLNDVDIKNGSKLTIQEITNADGYCLDNVLRTIDFTATFSTIGKKLISYNTEDSNLEIEVDNINNVIEIKNPLEPSGVSVVINKKDFDDRSMFLADAEIEILDKETNTTYPTVTDENGKGYVSLPIKSDGTYLYDIIEKKAPKGYHASIEMQLEVNFFNNIVASARIVGGSDVIELDNQEDKNIELSIFNREKDKTVQSYAIELIRANAANTEEHIINSKNKIVISNTLFATTSREDYTNANGHLYFANALKTFGDSEITINETEVAEGYIWDSRTISIQIERNDDTDLIQIKNITGAGSGIATLDHANKLLKIVLTNNKTDALVNTKQVVSEPFKIVIKNEVIDTRKPVCAYYDLDVARDPENVASTWIKSAYHYKNLKTYGYYLRPYRNYDPTYWDPWVGAWLCPYVETGEIEVNNMYGDGDIFIDLKQIGIVGYEELPEQHIIVTRNQTNGQLTVKQDGDTNVKTTVNSAQHTITITVTVKPTLTINVEKRDTNDENIKLENVEFEVTSTAENPVVKRYITTDSGGQGSVVMLGLRPNKSYTFTIKELPLQNGYKQIDEVYLGITTNEYGLINTCNMVGNNEHGKIYYPEEIYHNRWWGYSNYLAQNTQAYKNTANIKLLLDNSDKFTMNIINEDDEITGLGVKGSEFELTITDENNNSIVYNGDNNLGTDENGNLSFSNLSGRGNLNIHYKQTKAGLSYRTDENLEGDIQIYKNSETYGINVINHTGPISDIQCDENEGIITIKVLNERRLIMELEKVDMANKNKRLQGAEFKVTSKVITREDEDVTEEPVEITDLITDVDGKIEVDFGKSEINSVVQIILEETVAPVGYDRIGKVKLLLTTNEIGEIVSIDSSGSSRASCSKTGITAFKVQVSNGTVSVNANGENVLPYTMKIKTIDNFIANKAINNIDYRIQIYQNDILYKDTTVTTQNVTDINNVVQKGIAELTNLDAVGIVKVVITEKNMPDGYKLEKEVHTLMFNCTYDMAEDYAITKDLIPELTYDETNSTIPADKVNIDNKNRIISIDFEKEPVVVLNLKNIPKNTSSSNILPRKTYRITSYEETTTPVDLSVYNPLYDETIIENIIKNDMVKSNLEVEKRSGLSGELSFEVGKPLPDKTIVYVIEELNGAVNYIDVTKFGIRFDSNGKIDDYFFLEQNNSVDVDANENYWGKSHANLEIQVDTEAKTDTFELNILKVNEINSNVTVPGVSFKVEVYNEQHDMIEDYVKATDDFGIIELGNVALEGETTIKITEESAVKGYLVDGETREFVVKNKSDGTLKLVSNSDNLAGEIQVDPLNRIIKTEIKNKIDGIGFVVENVDSNDYDMLISGAEFELIDDEIYQGGDYNSAVDSIETTGIDRIIINNKVGYSIFPEKSEGIYTYSLRQVNSSNGYKLNTTLVKFEVEYGSDKRVKDVNITKGYEVAATKKILNNYFEIAFINEQSELNIGSYTLNVIKVDENDKDIVLPSAEFDVRIENEIGVTAPMNKNGVTNIDGKLSITGINGAGIIKVKLDEKVAPEHYQVNLKELSLEVSRDSETGKLLLQDSNNLDVILNSTKNEITVYVADKIDDNLFTLVINKVDETGSPIVSRFTRFGVTKGTDIQKVYATNASGRVIINQLEFPEEDGTFSYYIKEVQSPSGYKKQKEEIEVQITVETDENEEKRKITNVAVMNGNTTSVETYAEDYVELSVVNKVGSLFIEKQDTEDNLLKIVGTVFEITNDATQDVQEVITDEDGIADLDLGVGTYTIVEKQETNGYIKNGEAIKLEVLVDSDGKKQYNLLDGANIATIEDADRQKKIAIKNKQQETDLQPYSIEVVKVDYDDSDIKLENAEIRIDVTNQNGAASVTKTGVTNENGIVSIDKLNGSGDIEINLLELTAPTNRKQEMSKKTVQLYRSENTGNIECDFDGGLDVVINNNKITIYITNTYINDYYTLALQKVDANGNRIESSDVVFELANEDMTDVRALQTNENGKVIITDIVMPSVEKDLEYTLREIQGADGYEINLETMKLYLSFRNVNGKMKLMNAYTNDSEYAESKKVTGSYALFNVKNEEDVTAKIVVNKVDDEDNVLKIPDIKFEVTNSETGETKEYTTDKDGKFNIVLNSIDTDVEYTIKEITKDAGLEEIEEVKLSARFDSATETVTTSIISGNDIVDIDNSGKVVKLNIKNKQKEITTIGAYKVEIIKCDKDEFDLVRENALLRIDIQNENGVLKATKTEYTNSEGMIVINKMNGYGDISLTIQEKQNPKDYELDTTIRKVNLFRDEYTGVITLESTDSLDEKNVIIDNISKTIRIYVPNKLESKKYNIIMQNVDDKALPILNNKACFEITNTDTGVKKDYYTNQNGKLIIDAIKVPEMEGSVYYRIKQKTAPKGYKLSEGEATIEIQFKKLNGVMIVTDMIIDNTEFTKQTKVTKNYVRLDFINKPRTELYLESDVYTIDKYKINEVDVGTNIVDFVSNLDTNGTIKIFDLDLKELDITDSNIIVQEGYIVRAEKDQSLLERKIALKENIDIDDKIRLESTVYTIDDLYIDRVYPNTKITDFISNLDYNTTITLLDAKGNNVDITNTTKFVGTGFTVRVECNGDVIEKKVVVVGDVNGDGEIGIIDVSNINRWFVNQNNPSESSGTDIQKRAADINGDDKFSIMDTSRINRFFVKTEDKLF